jgi:hypothetical protein
MLKQPASFVLSSQQSSTGTPPPHHSAARTNVVLLIRRTVRPRGYASALHSLRSCWTACLSILQEYLLLFQTCHHCFPRPANVLVPGVLDRLQFSR